MKKLLKGLVVLSLLVVFAGCSSNSKKENKVVKLGITGDVNEIWKHVQSELEKEGITLDIVTFTDYNQPNTALAEKEIDLNSFQHYIFLEQFNKDHNLDLVPIGETVIAPLGIYSDSIKDLKELKEGSRVAIPNDVTNGSRSLVLLQTAKLIKLKDGVSLPTINDIVDNPLKLDIIELDASQTARSLSDVDAACINSGMAVDAGFTPATDAIYLEPVNDASKPYVNIIVARKEDKDNETYKKVVAAYQSAGTKKVIEDSFKGSLIPAWK